MAKRDARSLDHKTLEQIRIRAVERVQAGESPEVVIQALGFSRACIYNWLAAYRAGGWDALQARKLHGRPKKISAAQMQWLYETVVGKSPVQFRFEFALWTRQLIQAILREQFGLKLSLTSVGRLLAQLGLTCQRPLFRATEQDPARVEHWRRQEYPAIQAAAKQAGAAIFFADESTVRSDYHSGTTWGVKGQTPVVRRSAKRAKVHMLSAISAKGELRFMLTTSKVDAAVFVEFLGRLLHNATAPVFLVVDGHPVHRARKVAAFVEQTQGRLRLFFLPPYSPELNPDEQVWNYGKNHGIGRTFLRQADDLKRAVLSRLHSLQRLPWTIRMFFLTKHTYYAIG
jgi:transposase